MMSGTQTCSRCLEPKVLIDEFSKNKASPTGYRSICKQCDSTVVNALYQRKKEIRLKQTAAYRRAHPEMARVATKKWKINNPEDYRASVLKGYPKRREAAKKWLSIPANRKRYQQWLRDWAVKNKDRINEKRRADPELRRARATVWRNTHRDVFNAAW